MASRSGATGTHRVDIALRVDQQATLDPADDKERAVRCRPQEEHVALAGRHRDVVRARRRAPDRVAGLRHGDARAR